MVLNIGLTPERLVGLGFDALTLVVKAKTIGKMFFDHGLTQGQIERIPPCSKDPGDIPLGHAPDQHGGIDLRAESRLTDNHSP
jgi:hypothetical protein